MGHRSRVKHKRLLTYIKSFIFIIIFALYNNFSIPDGSSFIRFRSKENFRLLGTITFSFSIKGKPIGILQCPLIRAADLQPEHAFFRFRLICRHIKMVLALNLKNEFTLTHRYLLNNLHRCSFMAKADNLQNGSSISIQIRVDGFCSDFLNNSLRSPHKTLHQRYIRVFYRNPILYISNFKFSGRSDFHLIFISILRQEGIQFIIISSEFKNEPVLFNRNTSRQFIKSTSNLDITDMIISQVKILSLRLDYNFVLIHPSDRRSCLLLRWLNLKPIRIINLPRPRCLKF